MAGGDKTAGEAEAIHDKIAEEVAERVDEFIVDPSIEAILEAVDRVDEEANEIIVEKLSLIRLLRLLLIKLPEAKRSKPVVKIEVIHFKIFAVLFDPIIKVVDESRVIISRS